MAKDKDQHNDMAAALAGLLDSERLTRQVAAARAGVYGRWIDCDRPGDSDAEIADDAIRQAARLLPGMPVTADLRFEVLAVWSGETDEDTFEDDWGRGLVGDVTLADGRRVRLSLGVGADGVWYDAEGLPPPEASRDSAGS
jgi:hypothetical protein